MDGNKPEKIVIGFWIRLLTDIVDAIILGIFGALISIPLKPLFNQMGENGLWVGLCVSFLYVGILQSKIGKGQSIAKRLFKIEVIRLDGGYLSLVKSFMRYIIIALIFYNSWIWLALTSILPILNNDAIRMVFFLMVACLFIGTVFLVAFHPQKRGLHDYIAGSIVVPKGAYDNAKILALNSKEKERNAILIWIGLSIAIIIASFFLRKVNSMDTIQELVALQKGIDQKTNFTNISINLNTKNNSTGTTKTLNIQAFLAKKTFDIDSVKKSERLKLVEVVKSSYPHLNECDAINVLIRTGFNIGIYSFYYRENTVYDKEGQEIKKGK